MRRGRHLVAAAGLFLAGCTTLVSYWVLPREGVRGPEYSVRIERGAAMVTSDGIRLVADIYHPRSAEPAPTILVRIPFTRTFKNGLGVDAVGKFWATRGYHVVIQGTRGRYKSGGNFYPLAPERRDGIETLQWLARQPWFDGRLGMWGGSAFGHTQWAVADQTGPGPTAYIIQIASSDFHGMFYPGGAFSLESALFWAVRSRGSEDEDPDFRALERGFRGFPLIEADDRAVRDIGFFDDWVKHPGPDAYWRDIDGQDRAKTIQAPALLMAGWYDPFLPTQLRDFETIRKDAAPHVAAGSRLIVGPWTHADHVRFPDGTTAGDYRPASVAPSMPWFDHYLLGRPLDASLAAPVRIYVMGENVWRDEQEWPLTRARETAFYLSSDGHANTAAGGGRLLAARPSREETADTYDYDPRDPVPSRGGAMLGPRAGIAAQDDVESRPDVLVYTSEVLDDDMEVTGLVRAVLHVDTTAPNTDFTAKLVDVHADGRAFNVCDGVLRRRFSGRHAQEITIDLWSTSMLFRRGHRIRVEVSSSNFPRYDRNPNTGGDVATETRPVPAKQTVYHGVRTPSRILLPIVPRG
jgi:putative CocE/NonD family hydrolase